MRATRPLSQLKRDWGSPGIFKSRHSPGSFGELRWIFIVALTRVAHPFASAAASPSTSPGRPPRPTRCPAQQSARGRSSTTRLNGSRADGLDDQPVSRILAKDATRRRTDLVRTDVIEEERGEAIGVVQVRLMTRSGEDHESTALEGRVGMSPVREWDHRILVTPHDQHTAGVKQVQLVQGGDALA